MTVVAVSGNNGVPHNHNDIGNFVVARKGVMLLDDPGAEVYMARTFSAKRYESIFCNSTGHSVPELNGKAQRPGEQYHGIMKYEEGDHEKVISIDMKKAYPRGTVKDFTRTLRLDTTANELLIEDEFAFSRKPSSLVEAFVSCEPVKIIKKGKAVRIGPKGSHATLEPISGDGKFALEVFDAEDHGSRTGKDIRRITWQPNRLNNDMKLVFKLK